MRPSRKRPARFGEACEPNIKQFHSAEDLPSRRTRERTPHSIRCSCLDGLLAGSDDHLVGDYPVRGDPGGRPESPRVLRTVPGRILPSSRPGRCAAERGADATLCGGASTSSPPARARRARVTVPPTYRDGVGWTVWSRGACGAPGLSSFVGLLERAAGAFQPGRVLRCVDGSVPTGDERDCSRPHGGAKDHDLIRFEVPCSTTGWRGKQPKNNRSARPDISIGCDGSAPMSKCALSCARNARASRACKESFMAKIRLKGLLACAGGLQCTAWRRAELLS
jgi:hypothetical protein